MLSTRIMMTNYFNTWCLKLKSWIWESVISVKFFFKKSDNQGLSQGKHILSCLLVKKKKNNVSKCCLYMEHKQGERESCLHRGFENMCFRRIRRIKMAWRKGPRKQIRMADMNVTF